MPITRSAGPQGPSVTVLVGLMRVRKSSLRYEKEFPRAFRRRKPQSGVVAPSEPLANPSKPPPQIKSKNRSNAIASGSNSPSQEAKMAAAVKRGLALLDDGQATTVEENRVFCQICNEWIELKETYCVEDWLAHKRTCKKSQSGPSSPRPKPIIVSSIVQPPSSPVTSERVEMSVTKPPLVVRHRTRTESERAATLYNDSRIAMVEARRVRCGLCGLWIKLRNTTTFCPTPWRVHIERCAKRSTVDVSSQPALQLFRESTPSGLLSSSPESEG